MTKNPSQAYSKYLGIPYFDKGRNPFIQPGWDCYGLYRLVFGERSGVWLPTYTDSYLHGTDAATVAPAMAARHEWAAVPLGSECEGDGIVFNIGGEPLHCGYIIEPGKMLHVLRGRETCFERYTSPVWQKRIEGIYRWQKKS